jgi:hypothetical protein
MAYSNAKLKSNGDRASLDRKTIRQMFTYTDFTIHFVQTHFNPCNIVSYIPQTLIRILYNAYLLTGHAVA